MDIPVEIRTDWETRHGLCRESCRWLHDHADLGDLHPIATAVAILRATARSSAPPV